MAHDDTEQVVGEEELAAFQLHDDSEEHGRDRNDGKPESEFSVRFVWDQFSYASF